MTWIAQYSSLPAVAVFASILLVPAAAMAQETGADNEPDSDAAEEEHASLRGADRRPRQPRAPSFGDRIPGSHRRDSRRGHHAPGRHHARLPVAEPDPLLQRRDPSDQRRGNAGAAVEPAQPRPRPHADPGQRQAAAPVVGRRLVRRRDGRCAGARHLDHSGDRLAQVSRSCATAGRRSMARTRSRASSTSSSRMTPPVAAIELHSGSYIAGDGAGYTVAGNFGLPMGRGGFANLSVEYGGADPTDRSVQRLDAAALDRRGQHTTWPTAGADLGQPDDRGRREAVRQHRPPLRQRPPVLRLRQLRREEGDRGLLLPESQLAAEHLQPRRRPDAADRRRPPRQGHGHGQLPRSPDHERRARPGRPRPGVRRPELLLLPGDRSGRLHPAVRRHRDRQLGGRGAAEGAEQRLRLGPERQLRLARIGLLLHEHRQCVARPGHAARLRPRSLPPGRREPELRHLL